MNPHVEDDSRNVKHFKFSDSFLAGFNSLITTYDKKIEDLNKVKSLIDKDAHHGVCNCSYKMRYITPSDISTFISNLERAMENHLFKPHTSDCDLFAVESVKRFLQNNGCVPFDAPSIMGDPGANIPKGARLDDLTFAAESECFNLLVYSKYELEKRVDCMREDIGKIQNMHFSAAVKSFVQQLPGIMDKKATYVMRDSLLSKACEVYIEDFIMFALRLNLTTVLQMLGYAIPRVAYKTGPVSTQSNESANNSDGWDDDNDFFQQESVDETSASPVYFVFFKGIDFVGRTIRKVTDSDYSHIAISFDPSLDKMYSFSKVSFVVESIHEKRRKDLDINVFGAFISKSNIAKMRDVCNDCVKNIKKTRYDYDAIVKKFFGKDNGKSKGFKQICTTFVNQLVGLTGSKLSDKNIPSPKEMREGALSNDSVYEVYSGSVKDYSPKKTEKKLHSIAKGNTSKRFDEVVTECCTGFLKTNDYVITNKIPFNCNMRDIVLQDMHPQFKDTVSALKFIMNDERSPVHQLVIQYYTEPIDDYNPDQIIKLFFGCPRHNHWDCPNSRDALANNKANMNTDVNWLDKITYGNMFYDGNYRRDGLGNQHTHPIMNSFDTIYKMFGGCDNVCDNAGLSNSLIRISRVMKSIIEKYDQGCIPNWEMCRDILSVFGEIFTRHMLRLYYNNNRTITASDQMRDTIIPGYMYAESYVMEAKVSHSNVDRSKTVRALNVAKGWFDNVIKFFSDRLANFLPEYFKSHFQLNVKWFQNEGKKKYDEILNSFKDGKYKFPTLDKYYKFNVHFNPAQLKVKEVVDAELNATTEFNEKEFKKKLYHVFTGEKKDSIPDALVEITDKNQLKTALTNAVLYSTTETTEHQPDTDHTVTDADFTDIYNNLDVMCQGENGCKAWVDGFKNLAAEFKTELERIKKENNITTESFVISLDGSYIQEMNEGDKAEGSEVKVASNTSASKSDNTDNTSGSDSEGEAPQEGETGNNTKQERAKLVAKVIADVGNTLYLVSVNEIVTKLFPETYSTFTAIINDYKSMSKSNTNSNDQQNNNAEENNS